MLVQLVVTFHDQITSASNCSSGVFQTGTSFLLNSCVFSGGLQFIEPSECITRSHKAFSFQSFLSFLQGCECS